MSYARCRSCEAPMEWSMSTTGGRLPLDVGVLERAPQPKDVVLHVRSLKAKVVSQADVDSGDVGRWLAVPGCELRASHWETCAGAVNFRNGGVNEKQERLEL